MTWAQLLLNGLALGAAYALIALGFALVASAAGAVNFAHGDTVMLGGVAAVLLGAALGLPGWALLPLVALAGGAVGLLVGALGVLPLQRRPPAASFVATIALAAAFQHGALLWFGAAPRPAPALVGGGALEAFGAAVSLHAVATVVVGAALVAATFALLQRTQFGRRLRAVADDRETARALGLPATRLTLAAFLLGGALAGVAGLMLGHSYFVSPAQGAGWMLKAYIAVALGGWGDVRGAALAALGIGLVETAVAAVLSAVWADALIYVVTLAVLLLRPQGLFGEPAGRRV
jgi:branched-chain amino acid transport system permease protein